VVEHHRALGEQVRLDVGAMVEVLVVEVAALAVCGGDRPTEGDDPHEAVGLARVPSVHLLGVEGLGFGGVHVRLTDPVTTVPLADFALTMSFADPLVLSNQMMHWPASSSALSGTPSVGPPAPSGRSAT
jgi:hypothetical protein